MKRRNTSGQVNVRLTPNEQAALSALRKHHEPIPSASDVMRKALMEKFEREIGEAPKAYRAK